MDSLEEECERLLRRLAELRSLKFKCDIWREEFHAFQKRYETLVDEDLDSLTMLELRCQMDGHRHKMEEFERALVAINTEPRFETFYRYLLKCVPRECSTRYLLPCLEEIREDFLTKRERYIGSALLALKATCALKMVISFLGVWVCVGRELVGKLKLSHIFFK
jgi:hypothetical protein